MSRQPVFNVDRKRMYIDARAKNTLLINKKIQLLILGIKPVSL